MDDIYDKLSGFGDLEKYDCVLWRYTASLSQLYIRLFARKVDPGSHLYLVFHSVLYFSGPTKWMGADFRLGESDEVGTLLASGKIDVPDDFTELTRNLKLYAWGKSGTVATVLTRASVQMLNEPLNINATS